MILCINFPSVWRITGWFFIEGVQRTCNAVLVIGGVKWGHMMFVINLQSSDILGLLDGKIEI